MKIMVLANQRVFNLKLIFTTVGGLAIAAVSSQKHQTEPKSGNIPEAACARDAAAGEGKEWKGREGVGGGGGAVGRRRKLLLAGEWV